MSLDVQQPSRLGDLSAFSITRTSTPSIDERHRLPSIGLDISRPPSTSSQSSSYFPPRRPSPNPGVQLPALRNLSALATLANSSSPDSPLSRSHVYVCLYISQYQEMERMNQSGSGFCQLRSRRSSCLSVQAPRLQTSSCRKTPSSRQ